MNAQVLALMAERAKLDAYCRHTLLPRLANALAYALPTAAALERTYRARLDQLAALELAIASHDPQQGLFSDWHETGGQGIP